MIEDERLIPQQAISSQGGARVLQSKWDWNQSDQCWELSLFSITSSPPIVTSTVITEMIWCFGSCMRKIHSKVAHTMCIGYYLYSITFVRSLFFNICGKAEDREMHDVTSWSTGQEIYHGNKDTVTTYSWNEFRLKPHLLGIQHIRNKVQNDQTKTVYNQSDPIG